VPGTDVLIPQDLLNDKPAPLSALVRMIISSLDLHIIIELFEEGLAFMKLENWTENPYQALEKYGRDLTELVA
jgi:hypothetical protein